MKLFSMVNELRVKNGIEPVEWDETLFSVGLKHTIDMCLGKVIFGHSGFQQRLNSIPYAAVNISENMALSPKSDDPSQVK